MNLLRQRHLLLSLSIMMKFGTLICKNPIELPIRPLGAMGAGGAAVPPGNFEEPQNVL